MSYAKQMLDTHPRTFYVADLLAAAIDALDDCAQACNADNAGRQNTKLQYAVLAAAALHGGTGDSLAGISGWPARGPCIQAVVAANMLLTRPQTRSRQ